MTEPQNPTPKSNWQKTIWQMFIIIIVFALAIGAYFYFQFVAGRIDAIETKIEKSSAETKQLHVRLDQLHNSAQDLKNDIQKIASKKSKVWKPIVIEHLVRLADLTLNTTGDTKLALSFLSTAQQYATDADLSAINHAINKDIADLQTIPVIETETLILKLEALNEKIEFLPVVKQHFNRPQEKKPETITRAKSLWKRLLESTVKALQDVVTIRRQHVEPMLLPEQETNLRLTIQAKLLQAELAVINRQNKLYQSCLNQIGELIFRYFVANNQAAQDILVRIRELQQVDLKPKLPNITGSLAPIQDYITASNTEEQQLILIPQPQPLTPSIEGARLP